LVTRLMMPFGMNRTTRMMIVPRIPRWRLRNLDHTSSEMVSRMKAPMTGPKTVPAPPMWIMTNILTTHITSNTVGGSI